jgi:MSHA biogenesis protein MshO
MTDIADTALRRMSRDLRLALPNSVRVPSGNTVIEFLQTRAGGRYRSEAGSTTADDILDFSDPTDTTFELLGPPITFNAGDQIVIYNLGIPGADAYEGNTGANRVRRALNVAGVGTTTTVRIDSTNPFPPFPFDSPSHSFQVVDTPVSYLCSNGTLTRYSGYPIVNTPQHTVPGDFPAGTTEARLANNVTCVFTYATPLNERSGLVSMQLSITQGGETVTLYHQVHVSNAP